MHTNLGTAGVILRTAMHQSICEQFPSGVPQPQHIVPNHLDQILLSGACPGKDADVP
jgi:hypothetical protein